jgi:hypothetical protein
MRRSTVIALVGSGASLLIGGGAYLLEHHRNIALASAVERCHAEAVEIAKNPDAFDFEMICAPSELASGPALKGVQAEVAAANAATFDSVRWIAGAFVLFAISALPWVWYFLLRRIAEVRAAIAGSPPAG